MADDVTLNSMSGGPVVATDDSGTGHIQLVKLAYSADGDRTHIDADASGLKVFATGTVSSGNVYTVGDSGFPILAVDYGGNWAPVELTATGAVPVSVVNTIDVNSHSVTQGGGSWTVDGTVYALQNGTWNVGVSGTVTVGTHAVTQSGSWTVKSAHQPTPYKLNSAASTNATSVTATANTLLYGYYISNTNTSVRYVKFYNKASAPTVGTDTPVLVLAIPGSGAANVSFPAGINFTTGLAFATTTGAADSDTGAVAANEIIVNLVYATY